MAKRGKQTARTTDLLELLEIAEQVHRRSVRAAAEREQSLAWVRECRQLAQEPETGVAGLRSLQRDFLVEWNEGVGPDVEEFWRLVRKAGLCAERQRDVVAETLARGRIRNMDDYVALEDHFELLQTCGKIDEAQARALSRMLDEFGAAPENQRYFFDSAAPLDAEVTPDGVEVEVEVGRLVRVSPDSYRYDYFGTELSDELRARGHQGGGDSWAGIVRGLLELLAPDVLDRISLDPEAGCLAVWASDPAPLRTVAESIARAIREPPLLKRAIAKAEELSEME